MDFLCIPVFFLAWFLKKLKLTLLYYTCAHPPMYVCFPILSAWTLCSPSARFVGEIEVSILPSPHVSPPASFLPGPFNTRGVVPAGPVGVQDGDLLAQVPYNLLGSSWAPPHCS